MLFRHTPLHPLYLFFRNFASKRQIENKEKAESMPDASLSLAVWAGVYYNMHVNSPKEDEKYEP